MDNNLGRLFAEVLKRVDLGPLFAEALKPVDLGPLFAEALKPVDLGRILFPLHDQVDLSVELFRQKMVANELAEWILDQVVENKALERKRWLSESDRRAVGAALVFILIGAAVLAEMDAAPQVFDRWSAWLGSTTGLTSLVLYLLYQKQD